ncbi:polyprotein [Phytophthora megakarya]|uniref:Polyprotein n=1 Tax=Phytophthora megakarya TaxID=4795 RepID=A0A225UG02_9STRA|nr:polyprotein [Phytophthora megakarya]
MSLLEYIHRSRRLVSCITIHPVDMATQVHVFISGMNAGYQRFYLTRKTPSTLEEAFAVALREDYSVTASQAFDVSRPLVNEPEPEPMEVGALLVVDSRLIVLSLHVEGAKSPIRALVDSGVTNNFVRAEGLPVLPADMRVSEGPGHMVVKCADGKPRRVPPRSSTFAYEFDGFRGSDDFLPHIDWLAQTVRPRDINVNAVLASLSGTPNQWPHVAVMDPDSMATAAPEECDGPPCAACERTTCADPKQDPHDISDVVEHGFPRPEEQRLFNEEDVVEYGLPHAVEHGFPRVVERELPEAVDAVESSDPRPDADVVSRRPSSVAMIERGLSSAATDAPTTSSTSWPS